MDSRSIAWAMNRNRSDGKSAYGPEKGLLRVVDGHVWKRDDDSVANMRGLTSFALPGVVRAGGDPSAFFSWARSTNSNLLRVFPDWPAEAAGHRNPDGSWAKRPMLWNGHNYNFDDPSFWPWFADSFCPTVETAGFRLRVTVVVEYNRSWEQMRQHVAQMLEILGARRFHLEEDVNEPWNRGIDVVELTKDLNRHGVLCAYGIQPPVGPDGENFIKPPMLNYLTYRSARDYNHFFRSSRDTQRMIGFGGPVSDDEPCGLAEYQGNDPTGGAYRTNNLRDVIGHHVIGRFYGDETAHFQCGYEGRPPSAEEPKQKRMGEAIGELRAAIPEDAYLGRYTRNGNADFPLIVTPSDVVEDDHTTGYAVVNHGSTVAYVCVPRAKPDFKPVLINGWEGSKCEKIGPAEGFLYKVS